MSSTVVSSFPDDDNETIRNNLFLGVWEVAFSPNVTVCERPVVTLAVASLLNISPDLTLVSDPKRSVPSLKTSSSASAVDGDVAMAQCLLSTWRNSISSPMEESLFFGATNTPNKIESQVLISSWVDYATKVNQQAAIIQTLEKALTDRTYLVGHALTLADLVMYKCIGWQQQVVAATAANTNVQRWSAMIHSHPAVVEATSLAIGVAGNDEYQSYEMDKLVDGMNALVGASCGSVCTRFPPEPSGFLHIGHAKATLLNDYYATRYRGKLIVRFDDTNPSKEKEEYQSSILNDLNTLLVKPNVVTLTSDYFSVMMDAAKTLIHKGLAYMDNSPQDVMQAERMQKKESKHRTMSKEDSLKYFEIMCRGTEEGSSQWCLRAKIDMTSDNGTLRDPVIYRQNLTPHLNSGTTYKAYPTYDLACPIVDSIEGVSHALRTTEYNDRDAQYRWFQHALQLRRVRIHSFARMNFRYTELSKRKLAWFVEQGLVSGWDDARFPTIQGVLRRGVHVDALRQFILKQGASRRVVNMEWSKFWAENKNAIDGSAKRFMAIDATNHVLLTVATPNPLLLLDNSFLTTDYHPKNASLGKRCIRIASQVLLEPMDVEDIVVGEFIVLMRWGVVQITAIRREDGQQQQQLEGEFIPNGDLKAAKKKLSWIANVKENTPTRIFEFDNLILKEKLEENDKFQDFVNPNTCAETSVIGDAGLKTLQQNEIIQLERRGYFRVDRPYVSPDKPLILFTIPDGKMRAMSGLAGKLAHR